MVAAAVVAASVLVGAAVPAAASEVPGCEQGCEEVFAIGLPGDGRLVGLHTGDPATGLTRTLLAYYIEGGLREVAEPVELAAAGHATCGNDGEVQRCGIEFAEGAHGSSVAAIRLTPARGIEVTDMQTADTPVSSATDIDGDGRPDAVLLQSTYEPAYASAPRFWQTFLERNGTFVLTGCSAPEPEPIVEPRAPLDGPCPG